MPLSQLGLSVDDVLLGLVAFLAGLLLSSAIVVAFLVLISPDHFIAAKPGLQRRIPSTAGRIAYGIGKNGLGVLLVIAGILLSLPGVPGQGLLTVLVGLMLLDIPGKRRLIRRIVCQPRIRRAIDGIRRRFGRPPLELGEPDPASGDGRGADPPSGEP